MKESKEEIEVYVKIHQKNKEGRKRTNSHTARISWYSNSASHHSENGDNRVEREETTATLMAMSTLTGPVEVWVGRYVRVSERSSLEWGKKLFVFIITLIRQSKDHMPGTIIHIHFWRKLQSVFTSINQSKNLSCLLGLIPRPVWVYSELLQRKNAFGLSSCLPNAQLGFSHGMV